MAGIKRAIERRRACGLQVFRDEDGFTTLGAVLALLIALSLLFSAAQVQRLNAVSAQVQDAADAAALAAQNEVAEFMVVVRVCDAVSLTMSLTGLAATGLGVVALCTPVTAPLGKPLMDAGNSILKARDAFAEKASAGLELLQESLPFLCAANAASTAMAYGGSGSEYLALALPFPTESGEIAADPLEGAHDLAEEAEGKAADIQEAAARAEELAVEAAAIKQRAFARDCGDSPAYCMHERAETLAGLTGARNPLYRSVDSWSFAVALDRAREYYAARLAQEAPEGSTVEERAESALRERFYQLAVRELEDAYVNEGEGFFEASFPRFPRNSDEVRESSLYEESVYPISAANGQETMHAWSGCPAAQGIVRYGSVRELEEGEFERCPQCNFALSGLGKVAAASTSIENGFEYHYDAVAVAAAEYQQAMSELAPAASEVREQAGGLFEQIGELLGTASDSRIDAAPPGRYGTVVLAACLDETPSSAGFANGFVSSPGSLGARVALSSATLLEDEADQQGSVISSILDGLGEDVATGPAGIVLDCWSGLLQAYADGQSALDGAIEDVAGALPLASASGLGTWASGAFRGAVSAVGLQPADLDALKPILVNSAHVAKKGNSSFGAELIALKQQAIQNPSTSTDLVSSAVGSAETALLERIDGLEDGMELVDIQLFDGGPSITIRLALPPVVADGAEGFVRDAADAVRDLFATVTGVRAWE